MIIDDVIEQIRRNRISTTEVADALGKSGVLPGMQAVTPDLHRVGPIHPIFAAGGSNHGVHVALPDVQAGEVAVVFTDGCEGRAVFGDLMAKYALLYRDAAAMVSVGLVRDAARLRRERYAVWSHGFSPLGCVNQFTEPFPEDRQQSLVEDYRGGVAVCDDGGVVLIPGRQVTEDLVERLQRIELQEDVWYYCLDTLKWDTKRIVCDREYLTASDALPPAYREALAVLERRFESME